MTETLPAVTAAREARGAYALRDNGDLASLQRVSRRSDEALRDLLAVVDRLTAPPSEDEIEAGLKAWFEHVPGANYNLTAEHVKERNRSRMKAALAASGRRHLPTETEWGTALRSTNGEVWDHFSWGANEAGARKELVEWNPDDTAPDVLVLVRRTPEVPAGPWEVCDEQ